MGIRENIESIRAELEQELQRLDDVKQLEEARQRVLGKKGSLTALLRSMGQLSPEERPAAGQMINAGREKISAMLDERLTTLKARERERKLEREALDVTEPRDLPRLGVAHPTSLVLDEVLSALTGLGFDVVEGPEIELDHYNFELLNLPKNHPARDAQDTFYVDDNIVLRTHTSPVQARTMLSCKPPIRIACPGRVFRADEVDATHSPVFHQMEGLVIDEDVTMADLKGTLDTFAKALYGDDVTTRFRPSFFPFTEPSFEVDFMSSDIGRLSGKWIEIMGCGMVDPNVLENVGLDPKTYSGYAFGLGVERVAMLMHSIDDIRHFYTNDVRFLRQFRSK